MSYHSLYLYRTYDLLFHTSYETRFTYIIVFLEKPMGSAMKLFYFLSTSNHTQDKVKKPIGFLNYYMF